MQLESFKDLRLVYDRFSIENLRDSSKDTLTFQNLKGIEFEDDSDEKAEIKYGGIIFM